MAGTIMTSFSAGDANATALMENANKTSIGLGSLSLTHMTDTTVPAIAAGSWIEINGAIAKFDTETAISTTDPVTSATVADGTVYIILIPSGSVVNAYFTATAPTWSETKQGWYGSTTWENNRYTPYAMTKATTSYSAKYEWFCRNNNIFKAYANGDLYVEGTLTIGAFNMYGYGDVLLYTATFGGTNNIEFYVIKPIRVYFVTGAQPWKLYEWVNGGYVETIVSTSAPNPPFVNMLPGRYKLTQTVASAVSLRATYIEGNSVLSKANCVIDI